MKKLLPAAGIVILLVCVIFLFLAILNLFGYYRVLDGSPALYAALHRRTVLFFVLGAVLAAAGAACLIIYFRALC